MHVRLGLTTTTVAALAIASAACTAPDPGTAGSGAPRPNALRVVATTTVLGDLVQQVGGEDVAVHSLVPKGGEVHTFDPSPSDATAVADAQLLVMNGLGLDEWLADIAIDAGADDISVVELAEDLDGVSYLAGDAHEADGAGHAGEELNPHLWLNIEYAILYVERLAETLAATDPDHADAYRARSAAYVAELQELDAWTRERMGTIPDDHRRVISFHEAFPYFAAAYGLEIVGTVVEAPGQDPSAGEVAALIDAIEAEGASAIFTEAQFPTTAAERISEETGVSIVGSLYTDSLGDPPVDTYAGMMRWNVEQVVAALQ
jgi:manganese/iron transport system substrate-binding protein